MKNGYPEIMITLHPPHYNYELMFKVLRQWLLKSIITAALIMITNLTAIAADEAAHDINKSDWKIGYWAWRTSFQPLDLKTAHEKPVDLLYVDAGEYRAEQKGTCPEQVEMSLPESLPPADAYLAVLRFNDVKCPSPKLIDTLLRSYQEMKLEAQHKGRRLIGLQLDYDCPSKRLADYAQFLKALRGALPKEELLSITALLDWFGPRTAVAEVIRQVDEFVPQFYDVAPGHSAEESTGLARVIGPSWGKTFNAFGKPYRLGIASFGRIIGIFHGKKSSSCSSASSARINIIDDSPLELLARNRLITAAAKSSKAGEKVVRFKNRSVRKADNFCNSPGDEIKMIIPTRKSVYSAYVAAKAMGGWCKGVVFFRWPLVNEAMAFSQPEVDAIIAGKGAETPEAPSLESKDGLCAAVSCRDLYLRLTDRFPEKPVRFLIHSSKELEYFLPDELLKSKVAGSRTIEVSVPANAGVPRIFLGRAVTIDPSDFTLEKLAK